MNEERSSPRRPQEELDETTCWELLTRTSVGRLAVDIAGQPDIFPINYIVDGATIVFRSGAGTKLAGAVLNHHVAFEIDGYTPDRRTAWSVVVKGRARQIDSMLDVYRAEQLPLYPWVVSHKPDFVRIEPGTVTWRRFHVADDVAPDTSIGWEQGARGGGDTPPEAVVPQPGADYHPGAPQLHPS
jgi:hypothetical protein